MVEAELEDYPRARRADGSAGPHPRDAGLGQARHACRLSPPGRHRRNAHRARDRRRQDSRTPLGPMEAFAAMVEASALGGFARGSSWAYPVANLIHLLGLVLMRSEEPPTALQSLMRIS